MGKIIRVWYGLAHRQNANDYSRHVQNDIFPRFSKMRGNLGAKILRREVEDGVEFAVITAWDSMEAIKDFAKDDIDKAVVAEVAQPYFIKYDQHVSHYAVDGEMGHFG